MALGKHNFYPITFLFLFISFFVFLIPANVASLTKGYTACAPFKCGHFDNITYPFSNTDQPEYCGHPKFKLDCHPDMVTMEVDSQKFLVRNISQKTQILRLEIFDLLALARNCLKHSTNISLDSTFFSYTFNNDNYTLFYDCKSLPSAESLPNAIPFNCLRDGDSHPYEGYVVLSENTANFTRLGCKINIIVPLLKEVFNESIMKGWPMKYVLAEGLEVRWSGVDSDKCYGCIKSGGSCGYNASQNAFICLCSNQQSYGVICSETPQTLTPALSPHYEPHSEREQSHDHYALRKWKWEKKIISSVVSSVLGAIAIIIAIYFYWRRAKSYMQSQSLSSGPSSTDHPERGSRLFGAHIFTYAELEEATNNFDSKLGDGGYGTVYLGKLRDGRCIAVKKLHQNNCQRIEQFMNEVQIMSRLVHPNLMSLYGCTSRHDLELLLVYEYIPNGTLADHLRGKLAGKLCWTTRMNIAVETANALKYLHASEIIHRDVKTNNILLDSHFHVKVADFGISRLFPNNVTHVLTTPQGTIGYVDPEYHRYSQLTRKSDVYSYGVVLIELISSLPPVDNTKHTDEVNLANRAIIKIQTQALHELVDQTLGFESDCNVRKKISDVGDLAFRCLQGSKSMRPSMNEVLDTLLRIQRDDTPP